MAPAAGPSGETQARDDALRWPPSISDAADAATSLLNPPPPELPHESHVQVTRLFNELDTDDSGTLDAHELESSLRAMGLPSSPEYIQNIMAQFGTNGSGTVDPKAFRNYVSRKEATMLQVFKELDVDGTGGVDEDELLKALRKLGVEKVTPDDADRMIQLLDRDGDRQIDYEEFRRFVVLLPAGQLHQGGIVTSWIDSADWMAGIEYRLSLNPPQQLRERLLAGGVAGAVSRTVVAPLERLRTMMMADARNSSLPATVRKMWADGGLRGLLKTSAFAVFQAFAFSQQGGFATAAKVVLQFSVHMALYDSGNLATVTKVVPQCAIQMAVYDSVKDHFQAQNPDAKLTNLQRFTAGVCAGAASTLVTYPMENLRTHVSLGRGGGYLKILREIYQDRGFVRGVYGGFVPCMVNNVSTVGMGFFSYELGCDFFRTRILNTPRPPTPGERGVIAGCSAIGVMAATMPLEVVTRRMQVQGSPGHPVKYNNMAHCFRIMLAEEGLRAFYRGTLSSFMKVVPSIAIVRYMYEAINALSGTGSSIRKFREARSPAGATEAKA